MAMDLAGDGVAFRRHPQQHFEEFDGRSPIELPRGFRSSAACGDRGKAELHGGDDVGAPFGAVKAFGSEQQAASAPVRSAHGWPMSPTASSLSTRLRGTSRPCASCSRQAATSISTASSFGLRTRVLAAPRRARGGNRRSSARSGLPSPR